MICTEQVDNDIQLLPVWNCQNHINKKHLSQWIIFGANANTAKILAIEAVIYRKNKTIENKYQDGHHVANNVTDVLLHQDGADASEHSYAMGVARKLADKLEQCAMPEEALPFSQAPPLHPRENNWRTSTR